MSKEELGQRQKELAEVEKERAQLEQATADMVMCGEQQPESDHFVEMENSVIGSEQGTPWRETREWFAYKMKSKGKPVNAVRIESFSDAARDADVYVNGVKIGSVQGKNTLHTLLLPKELWKASEWEVKIMRGKSEVTPKFRAVRMILSKDLSLNE